MSASDGVLLAIAAGIVGAAGAGKLGDLVREPSWIMLAVAIAYVLAVVRRTASSAGARPLARIAVALMGFAAGYFMPTQAGLTPTAISTHSVPRALLRAGAASDLTSVLDQLDRDPQRVVDKRIAVSGRWRPAASTGASSHAAAVWEPVMTCCAADAIDIGFDVMPVHRVVIRPGERVRVSGVVRAALRDGELRYELDDAKVVSAENIAAW